MTRDYFAGKAMQADMTDGIHENDFAWSAARAYKMADAMLEARNNKTAQQVTWRL